MESYRIEMILNLVQEQRLILAPDFIAKNRSVWMLSQWYIISQEDVLMREN